MAARRVRMLVRFRDGDARKETALRTRVVGREMVRRDENGVEIVRNEIEEASRERPGARANEEGSVR